MDLRKFYSENLFNATEDLFKTQLNVPLKTNTSASLQINQILQDKYRNLSPFNNVTELYFSGLIDNSIFQKSPSEKVTDAETVLDNVAPADGFALFALKLDKKPTRTEITEITRAFNMRSKAMPVMVLLQYETMISLALPERLLYEQSWRTGAKVGTVIILRNIDTQNTHAGHLRILENLANHNARNFNELHNAWLKVLNIKTLNEDFYYSLAGKYSKDGNLIVEGWYQKCFNNIDINLKAASRVLGKQIEDELKPQAVIRIIIRMMFIWFMKEKGLIANKFFEKSVVDDFLNNENTYYNAILQNLFFAVLNKKIDERRFRKENPEQPSNPEENEHGIFDVMRYKRYFKDGKANEFLALTRQIPFVNGGLFQCHDYKFTGKDETGEFNCRNNYLIDAFSETKPAKVSDDVMFSLIELFNSYVWTIEESTPEEQDIALDPELLGTVFENIIGAYNPESKENARKSSGSFYTPKPIVDYICRESFKKTLKTKFPDKVEQIDDLIDNNEDKLDFPNKNNLLAAITSLKVLDPACGSGAFPMGMFNLMVRTIEKLQEH
ncbi:MAG: hypothetical protein LBP85_07030, partial [Prevotellaceae bacterium]|nr:hypothetical protein [Prevotellaceae bacterium]